MKYKGLENEGATCYMNSLLQTLFMTPQFRRELYKYRFDSTSEESTSDSIPHQLQQLFLKLQLSDGNTASTRKLIKSFQWEEADAFQQHDVQQFCRVLFEALESSKKGSDWIKNLYEGTLSSYVKCKKGHCSEHMENFMDLSLTIRNRFENVEYNSMEDSIKGYLKPTKLDSSNLYFCEDCGEKVEIEKGNKFVRLPPILTFQLGRFELNYETMTREKINKFFYFPELLQMHRFLKPYEGITVKGIPKSLYDKQKFEESKPPESTNNSKKIEFKEKTERPRKKSQQKERLKEETVSFVDEDKLKSKPVGDTQNLTVDERKLRNIELMKSMKIGKGDIDAKFEKLEKQSKLKTKDELENDILFGIGGAMIAQATGWEKNGPVRKRDVKYEHEEDTYVENVEYPQHTYALYAILVHRGNAYAGHYFAYINDGESWYQFNDGKVYKVSKPQIRRYGESLSKDDSNAYMLFYRDVRTMKELTTLNTIDVSPELIEKFYIDEENEKIEEEKQSKIIESKKVQLRKIEATLKITVYANNVQFQQVTDMSKDHNVLLELKERAKQSFGITEDDSNWRLRRYNRYEDSMLEGFDFTPENLAKTLGDLGMKDQVSLIIEKKTSDEVFEVYDPRKIGIKVNIWREGLTLLSEALLKPFKIMIGDEAPFKELMQKIEEKSGINNPIILRRTFTSGKNTSEMLSLPDNMDKTLLKLRFFNSLNLFIEPQHPAGKSHLWDEEFEAERYRFLVKFNNPMLEDSEGNRLEFYFDNRKTFNELKQKLGTLVNLPTNEFKVKRSNKTFPQIIELRKRLVDLKMVHSQELYLQLGRSTKGLVTISKGIVIDHPDSLEFIKEGQDQFEMDHTSTVGDLKVEIQNKHPSVPIENIRVREFRTGRFGEVYRNEMLVDRIIRNTLVWEEADATSRGVSIYLKKYDPAAHSLSPMQEVFVEYDASYQQFALILSEQVGIPTNQLYGYAVMSNLFEPNELIHTSWANINSFEGKIYESPLFLTCDGYFLIVKEGNVVNHTIKRQVFSSATWSTVGGLSAGDGKEKALKITVKKKQEEKQPTEEINPTVPTSEPDKAAQQSHQPPPVSEIDQKSLPASD